MSLLAYHNDPKIKSAVLMRLRAHAKADELTQGISWENGKGCAIGCTLHAYNHKLYEECFGIPEMLARLEDAVFEGMTPTDAKKWPVRFMAAILPGADLSLVGWKFLHWLMVDKTVNPGIDHPTVRETIKTVANGLALLADGKQWSAELAATSATSAELAQWSAESAQWSAARSARSAAYARIGDKLIELLKVV